MSEDLKDATIEALRRQLAVKEMELETKNERIHNLLKQLESLECSKQNPTWGDSPAKPLFQRKGKT